MLAIQSNLPATLEEKVMSKFELGFTPNNLKQILEDNRMNQKDGYELLGKSRSAFQRYLKPPIDPTSATMSHREWLEFLKLIETKKSEV